MSLKLFIICLVVVMQNTQARALKLQKNTKNIPKTNIQGSVVQLIECKEYLKILTNQGATFYTIDRRKLVDPALYSQIKEILEKSQKNKSEVKLEINLLNSEVLNID